MKNLLEKHDELRSQQGPLRPQTPTDAALAEIQEYLATKDKSFKPKNDRRKQ